MNKFLLHVNGVMAKGLEILNPIIAVVVFLAVLVVGTEFSDGDVIWWSIAAAVAVCMVSGPIAVLTNIRNMLREATRDRSG